MSDEDKKAIESAIAKLMYQKENFGFMERFTVDENWVALQALFAYQNMEEHDKQIRADTINEVISLIKSHRHYFIAPTLQKEIIEDLEELKEQNN